MGKFILGLFIALLIFGGCVYYIYRTTGYKFGIDSTIFSRGTISITSQDFLSGGKIPPDFTCDGRNVSPTIFLDHIPGDAKSLAIILDDVDSDPKYFTHWLAFNIDPNITMIETNKVLGNAIVGINSFGNPEYDGPCPPPGTKHNYYFRIFALDTALNLSQNAKRANLENAMYGHIIGKGITSVTYQRPTNQ